MRSYVSAYSRCLKFLSISLSLPLYLFGFALLQVDDLSLEERVGQVLMTHFHGSEANAEAQRLIQEAHIGGIIYYKWANELSDPQQVQHLSQGLQQLARKKTHAVPLLIAIDQEGGVVNRLTQGFTVFPGNYALGQTEEWQWGKKGAYMIGQELKAVGINVNFAPVVDVCTNSTNPVIGIRSFSANPEFVARWGHEVLQGYKQAGVVATLKHFPGIGEVYVDPHEALPTIAKKREILEQVGLLPFRRLASQAEMIMTAHLFVPALDAQQCVTFSKAAVEGLLRQEMNFQGVIVTDSLAMQGILNQCKSVEKAALKSLEAGHDLIVLGGKQLLASQSGLELSVDDVIRIHHFLVDSVKQGRLSEERLNASVSRLLALKQHYGLFVNVFSEGKSSLEENVGVPAHQQLAQQIARRALHVEKGQELLPLSFESQSLLIVAPACLREEIDQTAWLSLAPQIQIMYFEGLDPDQASRRKIMEASKKAKVCLYCSYNAWRFKGQQELIQQLTQILPLTVAIAVRDPQDISHLKAAHIVLCTFSPVPCSLQAAFDHLTGDLCSSRGG